MPLIAEIKILYLIQTCTRAFSLTKMHHRYPLVVQDVRLPLVVALVVQDDRLPLVVAQFHHSEADIQQFIN